MIKAVFFNRDFSPAIPLQFQTVEVDRYSWTMYGGPDAAALRIKDSADRWEMAKLLRCPVEIYDGDGRRNWWGYVNKVVIPYGNMRVGIGLENMFNKVAVTYSFMDTGSTTASEQKQTAWATDSISIVEYGQKESILSTQNSSAARAEAMRDIYLADHKFAPLEVEFSGGGDWIEVECVGWMRTLDWHYYSNSATTNVTTTTQISTIYADADQFFNGILMVNASAISSNEFRDGKATAYTYILELMSAGTTNNRPLLAEVDANRYLKIYAREDEADVTIKYLLRSDGRLETLGLPEPASHCICAKWVGIKDLPSVVAGLTTVRTFFIANSEYDVKTDTCTYKPAGAFEAVRLAKWLAIDPGTPQAAGVSGGGAGVLSSPVYTPPIPPVSDSVTYTWVVGAPGVSGIPGTKMSAARMVTGISSAVVGGTSVTFNVEIRSAIGSAGTNLLGSDQVASTSGTTSAALTGALASGSWLWLDISAVSGTVEQLVVTVTAVKAVTV